MGERAGETASADDQLERVAGIARRLAEAESLDETLQRVVDLAPGYIDHCDGASVMLVRNGTVVTPASTGPDAHMADRAQDEVGQGPCLSAIQQEEVIVIPDIKSEERWPKWREKVSGLGWRSMLGLRLFVAEDTMGALNLYSRQREGFDRHSRALGLVFASHAAVAMKAAINEAGLLRALESRDIIGQAKGVLMERERLSGEQAFDRLRQMSNEQNTKVRDLAQHIAESGEVPD